MSLFGVGTNELDAEVNSKLQIDSGYTYSSSTLTQAEILWDIDFSAKLGVGEVFVQSRILAGIESDLNTEQEHESYSEFSRPIVLKENVRIDLREIYWQVYAGDLYFKLGKQQLVWGAADGVRLLDALNPQSFREFILDDYEDSRIPVWMANVEIPLSRSGVLQLIWVPDTTVSELASRGSTYELTSPVYVPIIEDFNGEIRLRDPQYPEEGDYGIRYMNFIGGWDLSLVYLYHYIDTPIIRSFVEDEVLFLQNHYERSHLFGATASKALGDLTVRMEFAYETDRYHRIENITIGVSETDQIGFILGLDYYSPSDHYLSMQWYQSKLLDDDALYIREDVEDIMTLLWRKKYFSDRLTLSMLGIHSLSNTDGVFQPKMSYEASTESEISLSLDIFYGEKSNVFGQFEDESRISVSFVTYF